MHPHKTPTLPARLRTIELVSHMQRDTSLHLDRRYPDCPIIMRPLQKLLAALTHSALCTLQKRAPLPSSIKKISHFYQRLQSLKQIQWCYLSNYRQATVSTIFNTIRDMDLLLTDKRDRLSLLLFHAERLKIPADDFITALRLIHMQKVATKDVASLVEAIQIGSKNFTLRSYHLSKRRKQKGGRYYPSVDVLKNGSLIVHIHQALSNIGSFKTVLKSKLYPSGEYRHYIPLIRYKFSCRTTHSGKKIRSLRDTKEIIALHRIWSKKHLSLRLPTIFGNDKGKQEKESRYAFAEGTMLSDHFKSHTLSYNELLNMGLQLSADLLALGRPHRDLKAENVIRVQRRDGSAIMAVIDVGTDQAAGHVVSSLNCTSINELVMRLHYNTQYIAKHLSHKKLSTLSENGVYYFCYFLNALCQPWQKYTPIKNEMIKHFPAIKAIDKSIKTMIKYTNEDIFNIILLSLEQPAEHRKAIADQLAPYYLKAAHLLINQSKTVRKYERRSLERLLAQHPLSNHMHSQQVQLAIFQSCANFFQRHLVLDKADQWHAKQDKAVTLLGDVYALGLLLTQARSNRYPLLNPLINRILSVKLRERPTLEEVHCKLNNLTAGLPQAHRRRPSFFRTTEDLRRSAPTTFPSEPSY